jgi:hypothetical protein
LIQLLDVPERYDASSRFDDPLKAKLADGLEHFGTIAFDVLDILNAVFRAAQDFAQCRLTLGKRFPPKVLAVEHQQIKNTGDRRVIHCAAMQRIKIGDTIGSDPDDLSIQYRGSVDPGGSLDNQRITVRPIGSIHCVEPHPTVTDMDLTAGRA